MKKTGLLILVVILALGAIGVGYAAWTQTLTVTGNVATGTFGADFEAAVTNDGGTTLDPAVAGTWTNNVWSGAIASKNVGSTTYVISGALNDLLTVTVTNAYPGYYGSVYVEVHNTGSVPIKILPAAPVITVVSGTGAITDIAVTNTGSLFAASTPIAASPGLAVGTITIGVGTNGGATTDPPVTGGSYQVTFNIVATQDQ